MNESRDTQDIEQAYKLVTENEDNKVWKSGDCPEALGDSEHAHDLKPEDNKADGVDENIAKPEKADKDNAYYMNKISERLKENDKKSGKIVEDEINTSRIMSDEPKNIFDKLYDTIMEGDDPFADLDSMGGDELGGEEGLGDDEELDIGGDEVTLSLPRDMAEKLCDALKEKLGEGEDEVDEDPFSDDGMDDEMLGDAVVSQPDPKPLGGHGDRTHPAAGNTGSGGNKVKSTKTGSSDGGHADGGSIHEDPDPKPLGGHGDRDHPDAGNVASGSNKVNNPKSKALGD